jgi:hypothetical protein
MYEELLEKSRRKAAVHVTTVENTRQKRWRAEEECIRQEWMGVSLEFREMIPDSAVMDRLFYADALTGDQPDFSRDPQFRSMPTCSYRVWYRSS